MKLENILVSASIWIVLLLMHSPDTAAVEKTYTNSDLPNYAGSNSGAVIGDKPLPEGRAKKRAQKDNDESSQRYWCSKGTSYRNKIDKSKAKVEEAEQNLALLDSKNPEGKKSKDYKKKHSAAEKKLRAAKKDLSRSEKDQDELEQKAHRQNIPPGWLRCQFHY